MDHARLDACVLVGANVADGCTTSGTDPVIQLGDLEMGQERSRVVALYNGGDGDVSATVSAVAFAPAQATNHSLSLFRLEGGVETPATLPFELRPNHATELRVRVQFTANVAVGPVSGVNLAVTASHPDTGAAVPIVGNVTGCPAGRGDCDADPSNACETDTQTALSHCGGCGTACDATNGTPSCTGGVCAIACATGFDNCDLGVGNGCETDLSSDAAHCGACAAACSTNNGTPSCTAGACAIACTAGADDCDGIVSNGCETDLLADALHCSACGAACGTANGAAACSGGACGITCDGGFDDCDGVNANGCEAELATDLAHCGTCGTACSSENGTPSCTAGTCAIACSTGFDDCDASVANGCEADLGSDPLHCGGCATACDSTNGTATCTAGACGITCDPGFEDCDGDPTNGCEVNLNADAAHCGACAAACDATNGTPTCTAGSCEITCNTGYGDCDGQASTGCEVNLIADIAHCGTCATACDATNGTASCTAGVCGVACNDGYGDCDGQASTGCEVNLNADTAHCGACIVACNGTGGTASCTAGVCGISCTSPFADCDGTAATGCEIDLASDPAHCGSCVEACSTVNGTPSCTAEVCAISCDPGFADCDLTQTSGCEVDTRNDPAHCGACGAACDGTNGTPSCVGSACAITCNPGFADCDGLASNGCEVDLGSDAANCGGCGTTCTTANGVPACTGGTCGTGSCNSGFGDCDTQASTGCETDVTSDVANCGACNLPCVMYSNVVDVACGASACAITACDPEWTNFDGAYLNGCECKTRTASASCAAPTVIPTPTLGGAATLGPIDGLANAGDVSYYVVSFPYGGMPYIAFAQNGGAVFDVLLGCSSNPVGCAGTEAGSVTEWRFYDSWNGTYRAAPWPSTVIVRVRRAPSSTTCATYQLFAAR